MDKYLYMFVMNDCRTSHDYLSSLLTRACLYMCWCMYFDGHVLLQISTLKSWPSYSFYLLCEITCHIAFSFHGYLFVHTHLLHPTDCKI